MLVQRTIISTYESSHNYNSTSVFLCSIYKSQIAYSSAVAGASPPKDGKEIDGKEIDGKEKPPPDDSFFAGFGASSLTGFTNFGFGAACFLWRSTSTACLCGDLTPKPSRPLA